MICLQGTDIDIYFMDFKTPWFWLVDVWSVKTHMYFHIIQNMYFKVYFLIVSMIRGSYSIL